MKRERILDTPRLQLEPLLRSHAAELIDVFADARLYRFVPQEPPPSLEVLAERFEYLEARRSPDGKEIWLNWALRVKESGACIGRIQATVREDRSALLAYEIGPAYWGRGFAAEACRPVIDALFYEFAAERIIAEIDTRNTASIRLVERLGFERESVKVGADFFKGSSSDEYTYTLRRKGALGDA